MTMSRLDDALRADKKDIDLTKTGQSGMDFNLAALANGTPYVQQPLQILLTRAPKAFQLHPRGAELTLILKRMIENSAKNWTGFQQILEVETAQIPQGWDRQMLTVVTNTARGPITPTGTWDELYNESGGKFWNYYIETFLGNTTTQRPNFAELDSMPEDWLLDQYSFDIIAFEPDPTYQHAIKAWACAGMFPQNSVEITGERDTANAKKIKEYPITFPCICDTSIPVVDLATDLLTAMNLHTINPMYKPTYFTTIDANVLDVEGGLLAEVTEAGNTWNNGGGATTP